MSADPFRPHAAFQPRPPRGRLVLVWALALTAACGVAYVAGVIVADAANPGRPKPPPRAVAQAAPPAPLPAAAPVAPAAPESVAVAPPPRLPHEPPPAASDAMPAHEPDEPAVTVPPRPAVPDPALDALVAKEAGAAWAGAAKGPLKPVAAPADGPHDPTVVAAVIDREIARRLAEAKVEPSPRSDDAEFLRRVHFDLTGRPPTVAKVREFLASADPDKRARLVDELLASPAFGVHFARYWLELLVKRDPENNRRIQTSDVFVSWLSGQFNRNKPWDETVRAMLTAKGDQALAGETFFVLANSEDGQPAPSKLVGTAAALFLGNQLQCCECHVHPINPEWTRQDFWGLAAFFGKARAVREVAAKKDPNAVMATIVDGAGGAGKKGGGRPLLLADGSIPVPDPREEGKIVGVARPRLLDAGGGPAGKAGVNRAGVADWLTSPANAYFPRAAVNRVWAVFFARGFVNPLDDLRPDNVPSHPELLDTLAGEFVAARFDVKHLIRAVCRSETYQRSSRTTPGNQDDHELYSHMAMKVLPPRPLFAALSAATNGHLPLPKPTRAGKRTDGDDGYAFFDSREYDESPAEYSYGVPQLLRLMNTQLPPACDATGKELARQMTVGKAVEHLYLSALSRPPTPAEARKVAAFVGRQPDPARGLSAALWALLNSAEFVNNH